MSEKEFESIAALLCGGAWLPVTAGTLTVERIRQPLVGDGLLVTFLSTKGARVVVDPSKVDAVQTTSDPVRVAPYQQGPSLDDANSVHPGLDPAAQVPNAPWRPAHGGVTVHTVGN